MKPKSPSEQINALMKEHGELYRQFLPTLTQYSDMAKRALEMQIKICRLRFEEEFFPAPITEEVLIAAFCARETPAKLGTMLTELSRRKITVSRINYDPSTFTYTLFGK